MNYRLASGGGRFFRSDTNPKHLVTRNSPIKNLLNTITDRMTIAQAVSCFNPADHPSHFGTVLADWDASNILGLANNDPVASWTETNGFHATQATLANKPLWKTSQLNGYPAVFFDGTNDRLDVPAITMPQLFTIFAVARKAADTTKRGIISGDMVLRLFQFFYSSLDTQLTGVCFDTTPTNFASTRTAGAGIVTTWNVATFDRLATSCRANVNGVEGTLTATTGTPNSGSCPMTIGRYDTSNNFFSGDIVRILIMTSLSVDKSVIIAGLNAKYGVF